MGSIRAGLHKAAQGSWTCKVVCSHSTAGCPFALEIRHPRNSEEVEVWQMEGHQLHDPASLTDLSKLRMDPSLEWYAMRLLSCGVAPQQVVTEINNQPFRPGAAGSNGIGSGIDGIGGGGSLLAHFSNARHVVTKEQMYALQKRMRREAGFALTSDAQAVAALMAALIQEGCVPFYQPYKQSSGQQQGQPLVIVLQTHFQKRMLDQFGRRLVFLDATGGTNKYGYPLYSTVVSMGVEGHHTSSN